MEENHNRSTEGILVKCGGFSSQLARNVTEKVDGDPLWGSRFDATNPEAVIQTHLDFLGVTEDRGIELIQKSVQLAKEAKEQYLAETGSGPDSPLPLILGSIGPYGAYLHDGSEYSGSYADKMTKEQLKAWHRTRINICLAAGVDGLALETLPCQLEAEAVTEFVLDNCANTKFWVSFQCKDEKHLASGESFAEAALSVWRLVQSRKAESRLFGIGVNCVNPLFVTPLLLSLTKAAGSDRIPLVVYSNRGEIYDADQGEWTGSGEEVVRFVPEWIELGARIVGGCCRVYPTDVLAIRKYIDSLNIKP
uniref:Homocysteine S-methyltransferase 3 n=1 Tax=Drosophila rhopaloa TaxID=1041015 RepID=A0A6P4E5X5_DRORH